MDKYLEALDRISSARISLNYSNPFFGYLALYLKPKEFSEDMIKSMEKSGQIPTLAVDKYSNLYISSEFILGLNKDELKTLLAHEILHLAYSHHFRLRRQFKESPQGANISADLVVNSTLLLNNFDVNLFKTKIVKGKEYRSCFAENDVFTYGKIKIKDISKKTAEEIYDELMDKAKKNDMINYLPIDNHMWGNEEGEGDNEDNQGNKELEKEWKKRMIEANEAAKSRGKNALGLNRHIDELLEDKIDWRQVLQRQIRNEVISDYSWNKRSKKSIATDFYLPGMKRENVEVNIMIDLSGSIDEKELKEFLTEIVSMSNMFKNQIKMTIYTHETKVNQEFIVNMANEEKILNLQLKGGGGTEFRSVVSFLNNKVKRNELVIWLTDGYGDDITNMDLNFRLFWVLTKNGIDECIKDTGNIVRL